MAALFPTRGYTSNGVGQDIWLDVTIADGAGLWPTSVQGLVKETNVVQRPIGRIL